MGDGMDSHLLQQEAEAEKVNFQPVFLTSVRCKSAFGNYTIVINHTPAAFISAHFVPAKLPPNPPV
jgi:hypothetical protein